MFSPVTDRPTAARVLIALMTTDQPVHYKTIQDWLNAEPPYITESETIRSALRRLRLRGFIQKWAVPGYWIFIERRRKAAIDFIEHLKAVDLVGVTSPPSFVDSPGISGDWLDFAQGRFEQHEPFNFRLDRGESDKIRGQCQAVKKRRGRQTDRAERRIYRGDMFKLTVTVKGACQLWISNLAFVPELRAFLTGAGLTNNGIQRFFRLMFESRPKVGFEYPVKTDPKTAQALKTVKITTFQGPDQVKTVFASSHDKIEMESQGHLDNLETFLGVLTGASHASFFPALQVKKLSNIEKLLGQDLTLNREAILKLSETLKDLAKSPQEEPQPKDKEKDRKRPGVG